MEGLQLLYFPLEISKKVILFPLASLLRISLLRILSSERKGNLQQFNIEDDHCFINKFKYVNLKENFILHNGYLINTPRIIYVLKILVKLHQQVSHPNAATPT